jgi:prevent-host-death family protein
MRKITVTEVRKGWGTLLDLVEQGEEIVITRRGKQIARLVPDRRDNEPSSDG